MTTRLHACPILLALFLLVTGCTDPSGDREYRAGLRELNRENYERAFSLLEKSVSRRPGHIETAGAHNALGIAAWRLGRFNDARTAFEDSHRLNPHLVEPLYNLGILAAERDDFREATRYLNEAAALAPRDPRPLEYLAELHMQRGDWIRARIALYMALDREPRSARIYNSIAIVNNGLNQPAQAVEALMSALEIQSRHLPALYNLGVLHDVSLGDVDQARAFYRRYLSGAGRNDPRQNTVRAALTRLEQAGDTAPTPEPAARPPRPPAPPATDQVSLAPPPAAAATGYESLIRQATERARAGQLPQALDLFVRAADAAAAAGQVEQQERAYREAVRFALDQPRAHALMGQFLADQGRTREAAAAFERAATLNPEYAPAQLGLARMATANGVHDAAVLHYRKAVASDPTLADAFYELAAAYDQGLGLPENAARTYRDFARQFPQDRRRRDALQRADTLAPPPRSADRAAAAPPPDQPAPSGGIDYRPPAVRNIEAALQAFNRARAYQVEQDWERAIFFYLRSLEHDDRMDATFYNLGFCFTMNKENARAREAYQRALRLRPNWTDAQYNLALLQHQDGDLAGARRLLEEIVNREPGYAAAHLALGALLAESPATLAAARRHYERFVALAPNDPLAPQIRDWLNQ